ADEGGRFRRRGLRPSKRRASRGRGGGCHREVRNAPRLVGCGLRPQQTEDEMGRGFEGYGAGVDLKVVLAGVVHVALVVTLQVLLPVAILAPDLRGGSTGRHSGPVSHPLDSYAEGG